MIILDVNNRSLEVVDGAAAQTTEPHYVVSYVEIDNTLGSLTPASNVGQLNGVTPIVAIAAPATGKQRQLKFLSYYNADTASRTVTVRYNNNGTRVTIIKLTLLAGEQLQYSPETGWVVIDAQGGLKANQVQPGSTFLKGCVDAADLTTALSLTTDVALAVYLGIAGKRSSSMNVLFRITQAAATNLTYVEAGVFKGNINLNGNPTLTRLGTLDLSGGGLNSVGQINATVPLTTAAEIGDELWVVFGFHADTALALRAGLADDIQSGVLATVSGRPSTVTSPTAWTLGGATVARPWVQGQLA